MGLLEGAAIALVFLLIGRFLPGRRKGLESPRPPKPVCGCKHHHSFHEPSTGECHGQVDKATHYTTAGTPVAWVKVQCTCRVYSGPVPLPEVYAPELTSSPLWGAGDSN